MPSERRLHPASFLFSIAGQARELVLPGLAVLFTAGSRGGDWQAWLIILIIPYAAVSIGRCLSYRYRFEELEMVVRTGFIFRNERHIPYARIQNIDAIQNVFHRLLAVAEVRLETGAGGKPEATMKVLPVGALEEVRARVFAGRGPAFALWASARQAGDIEGVSETSGGDTLLALPPRELIISGFIDSRGALVVAAVFGLLWEFKIIDRMIDLAVDDDQLGRGALVELARSLLGAGVPPLGRIVLALFAIGILLLVARVLSMGWTLLRLHGFTLRRAGEDLRTDYGLLTRVAATIPLRRIQLLTITEGPLHRLWRRASVQVNTAGSGTPDEATARREPLAPIIRRDELPGLLREVLPGIDVDRTKWQPVHPRAFRRVLNRASATAAIISLAFVMVLKWWTLLLAAALLGLAFIHARLHVSHLGWATIDGAVLFRSGWLWRHLSVARLSKMQVVVLSASPFDRRTGMARVIVDTAGAATGAHRLAIPYVPVAAARELYRSLAAEAAHSTLRW